MSVEGKAGVRGSEACGVVPALELLAWDSEFFGYPVGRLRVDAGAAWHGVAAVLRESAVCVVVVEIPRTSCGGAEVDWDDLLRNEGGEPMGTRMTFRKNVCGHVVSGGSGEVVEFISETPELVSLAVRSGHASRFRRDGRMRVRFEDLYREWLRKCLGGGGFRLLGIEEGGLAVAMAGISAKGTLGRVELLAVAEEWGGRGLGRRLLGACEGELAAMGAEAIEIVTQKENEAACRLYRSAGFDCVSEVGLWHFWTQRGAHEQ